MMRAAFSFLAFAFHLLIMGSSAYAGSANPHPESDMAPLPGARLENDFRGEMVAMDGNRLLVLGYDGGFWLRSPEGRWSPMRSLPFRHVWNVASDPEGFLVSGYMVGPSRDEMIALFDTAGQELRRWYPLPGTPVFYTLATAKGRWFTTKKGLVPLLDDGKFGALFPFPDSQTQAYRELRLIEGERRVLCLGADVTLAHNEYARCDELSPIGWSFWVDAEAAAPMICGPWIIHRMRPTLESLEVHSIRTGALEGARTLAEKEIKGRSTPIACADSQNLAIGGRTLELAALPSLQPVWKRPLSRNRISEIAVLPG